MKLLSKNPPGVWPIFAESFGPPKLVKWVTKREKTGVLVSVENGKAVIDPGPDFKGTDTTDLADVHFVPGETLVVGQAYAYTNVNLNDAIVLVEYPASDQCEVAFASCLVATSPGGHMPTFLVHKQSLS